MLSFSCGWKAQAMPRSEAQINRTLNSLEGRAALLFFVAVEDRAWFNRNPHRWFRVRPVEPVEIKMLTQFERAKLRRDAPLKIWASKQDVVPVAVIATRAKEGQVPYRPIPI